MLADIGACAYDDTRRQAPNTMADRTDHRFARAPVCHCYRQARCSGGSIGRKTNAAHRDARPPSPDGLDQLLYERTPNDRQLGARVFGQRVGRKRETDCRPAGKRRPISRRDGELLEVGCESDERGS
jgi:hypothetical protein